MVSTSSDVLVLPNTSNTGTKGNMNMNTTNGMLLTSTVAGNIIDDNSNAQSVQKQKQDNKNGQVEIDGINIELVQQSKNVQSTNGAQIGEMIENDKDFDGRDGGDHMDDMREESQGSDLYQNYEDEANKKTAGLVIDDHEEGGAMVTQQ